MSEPLQIVLADLFYVNRLTKNRLCVPLNVAYIAAYTKQLFGDAVNITLFKDEARLRDHLQHNKPDIVGFSFYYWNTSLSCYVVDRIRQQYGREVVVAFGGPSIDSIEPEKQKLLKRFPEVDVFIEGEGEDGFAKLVGRALAGKATMFDSPIDCSFFQRDGAFVSGINTSANLDLSKVPSPYMTGYLDEFLALGYFPLLQATRTCPYLCTFCVAGKDVSKLRAFPLDQVKQEIDYIAFWNKDKPHVILNLAELNFGINKQDPELAAYIRTVSEKTGYPRSVYFYSDKRFTETSRKVVQALGDINRDGLVFSLQSDHPETLKAIHRRNLPDSTVVDGIKWAKQNKIPVTTEVIFGLPYETYDSMVALLNKSVSQGFDSIMLHNLFLMEGIELNREEARVGHGIKTKYRLLGSNYKMIGDELVFEYEKVVTENRDFSFEEFVKIRCLNLMFFSVFQGGFYKFFFQYVKNEGVPLATFFELFMNPDPTEEWPEGYLRFVQDFRKSSVAELYDDLDELAANARRMYQARNDVGEPTRLNPYFFSRLMYSEKGWVNSVLRRLFLRVAGDVGADVVSEVEHILILCESLIIDLRTIRSPQATFETAIDLNGWKEDKFHRPIHDFKGPKLRMNLEMTKSQEEKLKSFRQAHAQLENVDYYFSAAETIFPRADLFYAIKPLENGAVGT